MQATAKTFTVTKKKKSIYSFISFFVISNNYSKFSQYFLFCISELQYLAILLWTQFVFLNSEDSNPATTVIHHIAKAISFEFIWEDGIDTSTMSTLIFVSWIYIAFFSALIGFLAHKAYHGQQIPYKSLEKFIYIISQLHFGFIFWMINMVAMVSLSSRMLSYPSLLDYSIQNYGYVGPEIFLIILNNAIGLMTAAFTFEPFCSGSPFASQDSIYQLLIFLFKAVMAPIAIFGTPQTMFYDSAVVIVGCLISAGRLIYLMNTFNFYYYRAMQLGLIFSGIASWISLMNILAMTWQSIGVTIAYSPTFLVLLPIPLIIKLVLSRFKSVIEYYATVDPYSLTNKREIYTKLFVCQMLTERVNLSLNDNIRFNRNEIYFLGDLNMHSKSCEDPQCVCNVLIKNKSKKNTVNFCSTKASLLSYFHTVNFSWLTEATKKIKDCDDLMLLIAFLLFQESSNKLSGALAYIFSTHNDTLNFFMITKRNILIEKIQGRIFEYFNNNTDHKKLNIAKFVDYYCDANEFAALLITNTDNYIKFWEEYRKIDVRMTDMVERSEKIEAEADKIDRLWNVYVERYEPFYHIMKDSYRMYLILVRNAPHTSRKRIKKYHWKKNLRDFDSSALSSIYEEDLILSKTINFYISLNKEKIGKVLYVSENITPLLGYNQNDTVGRNINSLMPKLYAEEHDNFLYRHLDRSKTTQSQDYYIITGYMKSKAGYIYPCSVHVSIFPYIQNELVYFGTVKVLDPKCDHILVDSNGMIDSYTEDIGNKLNLNLHKNMHLKDICTNIDKINNFFEVLPMSRAYSLEMKDNLRRERSFRHSSSKVANDQDEQPDQETVESSVVLTFARQGTNKTFRYDVKIIKRVLLSKKFFILIADDKSLTVRDNKSRRGSIEEEGSVKAVTEEDPSLEIADELSVETSGEELVENHQSTNMSRFQFLKTNASRRKSVDKKKKNQYASDSSETTFEVKVDTNSSPPKQKSRFAQGSRRKLMAYNSESESETNLDKMLTRNLRKQNQPLSPNMRNKFIEMQSDRGSTTSAHNVHRKIEQAIYSLPSKRSSQILKFTMFCFLIVCGALLLIFLHETQTNIQLVKGSLSVITTSNLRLFDITDLNKRTRAISLFIDGIFDDFRYYIFGLYSVPGAALVLIDTIQNSFSIYNNQVRKSLDQVDPTLRMQFYTDLIPAIIRDDSDSDTNTTQYTNTFDLADMLIVRTKRLVQEFPYFIEDGDVDMNFILDNTLNKFLLSSEDITQIILDDNDAKLDYWRNLILYFIIVCCSIGFIQFSIFAYDQRTSVFSRDKFIGLFLRLNPEEVDQSMNHVRALRSELDKNRLKFRHRELEDFYVEPTRKTKTDKTKSGFKARKLIANLGGVNTLVYKALAFAMFLFILGLIPFIYISAIVTAKKSLIKEEISMLVQVNTNLYDLNLISTAIYEYVQYNGTTTVRTRPIGPEWEATYSRLQYAQQFFSTIIDSGKITNLTANRNLTQLLTGDVCVSLQLTDLECSLGQGRFQQGILGMNSFIMMTLRTVKDTYDYSDRSMMAKIEALGINDLIALEYIYYLAQMPAYQELGAVLETITEEQIQEIEELLTIPVIISLVVYVIFGVILSHFLWKLVEKERIRWKKMFRKIPFPIMTTDKTFKNYLARECGNILDSVKRRM